MLVSVCFTCLCNSMHHKLRRVGNFNRYVKRKSSSYITKTVGAHLSLLGLELVGGELLMSVTRGQCDARPTVTFPAARYHRPLAGNKLYCLATEARVNNLPRVALDNGEAGIQTRDLLIASPASQPLGHRDTL